MEISKILELFKKQLSNTSVEKICSIKKKKIGVKNW